MSIESRQITHFEEISKSFVKNGLIQQENGTFFIEQLVMNALVHYQLKTCFKAHHDNILTSFEKFRENAVLR